MRDGVGGRSDVVSGYSPTLGTVPIDTRSHEVSRALFDIRNRLSADGGSRLAGMSLDDLGRALWPTTSGWTVISTELGWHYVMHLAEHPEHGIGASLVSTVSSSGFADVGEMASEERWQALTAGERARNIRSAIYVQAKNRLDVLGLYLDLSSINHLSRSGMTALGFLLESPVFMDATTRTMVSLNPTLENLMGPVRDQWGRQSVYGVRPGGLLSPQDPASLPALASKA